MSCVPQASTCRAKPKAASRTWPAAPDAFTFEAWISTTDFCHSSALFSYALRSQSGDEHQRTADANHFVIFDPKQLVACHDFEYM